MLNNVNAKQRSFMWNLWWLIGGGGEDGGYQKWFLELLRVAWQLKINSEWYFITAMIWWRCEMLWCGELSGKGSTLISFPQKFHFFLRPFLVTCIARHPHSQKRRKKSRLPFEAVYFLSISQLKTFSFFHSFNFSLWRSKDTFFQRFESSLLYLKD